MWTEKLIVDCWRSGTTLSACSPGYRVRDMTMRDARLVAICPRMDDGGLWTWSGAVIGLDVTRVEEMRTLCNGGLASVGQRSRYGHKRLAAMNSPPWLGGGIMGGRDCQTNGAGRRLVWAASFSCRRKTRRGAHRVFVEGHVTIVALGPAGGRGRRCSYGRVLDRASFSTGLLEARPRRRRTPGQGQQDCRCRGESGRRTEPIANDGEGPAGAGLEASGQDHANRSCIRKGSAAGRNKTVIVPQMQRCWSWSWVGARARPRFHSWLPSMLFGQARLLSQLSTKALCRRSLLPPFCSASLPVLLSLEVVQHPALSLCSTLWLR